MPELDQGFTFENFVVGPANRLASAAARRAAESPGSAYNPLFLYSAPGLGKTHILGAITHQVEEIHPDKKVLYQTMEEYLGKLSSALSKGTRDRFRRPYGKLDVFLIDDIQFLSGQEEAQEIFLQTLDTLTGEGKQVVLASDRPPIEIEGLDARLRSRFEGGLLVEIGPPEYETQMAIIRRQTEAREQDLDPGVADVVGRSGMQNVRELSGALNRILALQELEERTVTAAEAAALLKDEEEVPDLDGTELGQFLEEISGTVAAQVDAQEAPWRKLLRETSEEAEAREFKADPLRRLLQEASPRDDVAGAVEDFQRAIQRLEEIKEELEEVGNPWPEAAFGVLKDPERLDEATALLASARERARPFPDRPEGPDLTGLRGQLPKMAIEAAEQLVKTNRPEYSPLFVWSPDGAAARVLLQSASRSLPLQVDGPQVALISVLGLAKEFHQALSAGVAGAWRERWWSADLLFVHGAQNVSETERAQDELFHLLEALQRRKARIMVAGDRPPSEITNLDDRLRSRFEAGLVLEVPVQASDLPPELLESPERPELSARAMKDIAAQDREWIRSFSPAMAARGGGTAPREDREKAVEAAIAAVMVKPGSPRPQGVWAPTAENVIWEWPRLEDRIVKEPD